ncbi:MAG: DUF2330 domain-containing protein [Myxococcota bacterium]
MKVFVPLVLALAMLASRPLPARACGAFFVSSTDQNVALGAQRALYVLHDSTIDLHIQPHAAPAGTPFVWIVPVPSQPTLALGSSALFDALDTLTQPTVTITSGGGGGGGGFCGSADKAGGGLGGDHGIDHFGGGQLGDYTYDIIAGASAQALSTWLTDNGYAVPATFADVVAPYADKVLFVAIKLTDPGQADIDLQPLVVSFARPFESSLGYAAGMSKLSTADVAPILVWVLADKRYRIANFGSAELSEIAGAMREQVDAGQEASYAAALKTLTDESEGRLAITEYAKDLTHAGSVPSEIAAVMDADAHYLTRLYMEVPRDALQDLVITFAANAPEVDPFASADAGSRTPATATCIVLAIAFVARRRRASER